MQNIIVEYKLIGGETLPVPGKSPKIVPVEAVLTRGYWLAKYEVTQSEWKQVMHSEPWRGQENTEEGATCPATFVSWNDVVAFCKKLTVLERRSGRLPDGWEYRLFTEAQWEHACRAGTDTTFSFGDDDSDLGQFAWFSGNAAKAGERYAHPVGQKMANPWGIFDMHGNVYEWCRDTYAADLPGGRDPEVDLNIEPNVTRRVHRGRGWGAPASGCTSAIRYNHSPLARVDSLGFRVALIPSAK
jgi:formylglycine-generating enzyme required for sulfatase activity